MSAWMIYGANGYMGELIAWEAKARALSPILAGRNARALTRLGQELGCETRIFDLSDPATIRQQLTGVAAVLHCAGLFSATRQPILDGYLRTSTHYLDITEEIPIFEAIFRRREEFAQAKIVALPVVGCTVVPTDCLAALLKRQLPDAIHLRLAFASTYGQTSRGTMKTVLELIAQGCQMCQDGHIVQVPPGWRRFPLGTRWCQRSASPGAMVLCLLLDRDSHHRDLSRRRHGGPATAPVVSAAPPDGQRPGAGNA